jgi:hypothetical protein
MSANQKGNVQGAPIQLDTHSFDLELEGGPIKRFHSAPNTGSASESTARFFHIPVSPM